VSVDVVLERVHKSFEDGRVRALEDVSFRIEPGELVALVGASGSGKSTLLNLVGALDRPDAGRVLVGGADLAELDATAYRATTVGFVFQFHYLLPTLSALENVQVPLLARPGSRRRGREVRAGQLLEEVGLAHRLHARPATLSGGERQRVALARALALEPPLLLADEPTGSLDSETGGQILALLYRLREERGMTILLVTNDDVLAAAADRRLRLRGGRVAEVIRVGVPRPA
jgi:ABC-type lipoprotein export system ATPase subunit